MKLRRTNVKKRVGHAGYASCLTRHPAFTLIEIMVTVAVMGIILAAGIPSFYRMLHKEGFSKAVGDVEDACKSARAHAILHDENTVLVFHPRERSLDRPGGGSAKFPDSVTIEMLDVNLREYKDEEVARVRFFKNGTSDEMTLIFRSDKGEWCAISLEITTGLAKIESDPQKFGRL
jgi:prepilin-type N-terminal cleavage/methylation domain-containing protein